MFTGLIEAVGQVTSLVRVEGGARVRVVAPLADELVKGDSVAVSGVCLTVTDVTPSVFAADIGPETLRVTTLGQLQVGAFVNLERPLRADSRLGGHFVQGHVDAVGRILTIRPEAEFTWIAVGYPEGLRAYVIPKGSIAVDGISLTIARLAEDRFDLQVIPHTWEHTNMKGRRIGDPVNLECDMIGKYIVRSLDMMGGAIGVRESAGIE